jgi:hypothetical protein
MSTYQIAGDHVIWEKLGNHVVIAELKTGKYCNIVNPTGIHTWELLTAGYTPLEINDFFSQYYVNVDIAASKSIQEFTNKLIVLGFITAMKQGENPLKAKVECEGSPREFEIPSLVVYDDIDTLLQLDPVAVV